MRWLAILLMLTVVSARLHFPAFVQFLSADDVIERIARSYEEDAGPKHEKPRPLRFGR